MLKMAASTRHAFLLCALAAMCGLCLLTPTARASAPIEGVWEFNGGAVDVVPNPGNPGTFLGVVSVATTFAKCSHPVTEHMWTEMKPQPDGSYWGLHRWYFDNCTQNPTSGPTAWRVLEDPQRKAVFLRVCFSAPGSNSQPTIAPDGTSANVTYGCYNSALIAQTPTVEKPVTLPHACPIAHALTLKLSNPKYDPLKQAVVWVNGKKVVSLRGIKRLKRPIRLTHLPKGKFTVKVVAITLLNHRLTGSRTYKGCVGGSGEVNLKGSKHRHHKPSKRH